MYNPIEYEFTVDILFTRDYYTTIFTEQAVQNMDDDKEMKDVRIDVHTHILPPDWPNFKVSWSFLSSSRAVSFLFCPRFDSRFVVSQRPLTREYDVRKEIQLSYTIRFTAITHTETIWIRWMDQVGPSLQ